MEVITSELTSEKLSNRCLKQLENLYEETRKFIKKRFYKKAFVQLDRFYI
jgi:predicted YcjX-like family ATPase